MLMIEKLEQLKQLVFTGDRAKKAPELVKELLAENVKVDVILNEALIPAMELTGKKFERKEFFVPELIVAAKAMDRCLDIIRPLMEGSNVAKRGTMVIGTVKGDQHDIGKNIVKMMFKGSGFEVVDVGHDVPADKFVTAAKASNAQVVGMSALLTTTMPQMAEVVRKLKEAGLKDKTLVIVGGAPLSRKFAEDIGADFYAATAPAAVELVKEKLGLR